MKLEGFVLNLVALYFQIFLFWLVIGWFRSGLGFQVQFILLRFFAIFVVSTEECVYYGGVSERVSPMVFFC